MRIPNRIPSLLNYKLQLYIVNSCFLNMFKSKRLAAFDFDSTICDQNSDIVVRNLLPQEIVDKYEVKRKFSTSGWIQYMQGIFELLHSRKIDKTAITKAVVEIPPVNGMIELIQQLKELNFDVIVISDANSYFIQKWLEERNLLTSVKHIFTNPGEFNDGLLKIQMYHVQDNCSLSTINLCKGQILEDFIASQKLTGEVYEQIIYVGDGGNDFCPMLRLNAGDLAFCRTGYKCARIIDDVLKGQPYKNKVYELKANVYMWKNGHDILKAVTDSLN